MDYRFLEPIDVLHLRGNKLFGDAGAHAEALMPPWPSLVAGSLRSRMLVDAGYDPEAFGRGRIEPDEPLKSVLGTPQSPGSFRVGLFTLGRREKLGIVPCLPPPADVVIRKSKKGLSVSVLEPYELKPGIRCDFPLPLLPVLRTEEPFKPEGGLWLSAEGLRCYLEGRPVPEQGLVGQSDLWKVETRLGIALNGARRSAEPGRIYTAETVALTTGTGFLVGVAGAAGLVPSDGMLRFGGDGRGVHISVCSPILPVVPWERVAQEKRFRLVLTTPAVFAQGWLPPGCRQESGSWVWEYEGLRAHLVSASIKRHEVVSGWDLASQRPKEARRVVPAGSVYWFERLEGGMDTLQRVLDSGLWASEGSARTPRQAEGFNSVLVAAWPSH